MTQKELELWFSYMLTIEAGEKLGHSDYSELLRLNHKVMELAHKIHNKNMLKEDK